MSRAENKTVSVKDEHLETIGNVVLLKNFKDEKNAPPALMVERVNESCGWQVDPESKCTARPYGFQCWRKKHFIVFTPGSKHGWGVCKSCLGYYCAGILLRPAAEAAKLAAEELERARYVEARAQAEKAHAEAKLCKGYSEAKPFGLCDRQTKFTHTDGRSFCGRHAVRFKRRARRRLEIVA